MEEITAIIVGERARKNDWCIVSCQLVTDVEEKGSIAAPTFEISADEAPPDTFVPRLTYRLYGVWKSHPKHGRQFQARTWNKAAPHGRTGTIRYLMQAPWVGHVIAEVLWDKFAGEAVRILREEPEVATVAVCKPGFTLHKAQEAAKYLEGEKALEGVSIDLMDLLDRRGVPKNTARKAIQQWGGNAPEFIKRNPYLLMHFRGCGFLRTDAMYLDLGHPAGKLKRQAYCAWHSLASDREGHTWHPKDKVIGALKARIAGAEVNAPAAVMLAKRGKLVATKRDELGNLWVAEYSKARAEGVVAERVAEMLLEEAEEVEVVETVDAADEPQQWCRMPSLNHTWPAASEIEDCSPHQVEQLGPAIGGRLGLLTGSPGTGKTFTLARLVKATAKRYGIESIAAAAPTGKAAVRISEGMVGYGVDLRARTIHALLGVEKRDAVEGWGFAHGPNRPLPFKFLVVDESSMTDCTLQAAFLSACARGTNVLFVGDPNQLPPVGHGAPLRDLIAAGVPCGELREIRRNSGAIVEACAAIRDGLPFRTCERIDIEAGENLKLIEAWGPEQQIARMLSAIAAARQTGMDPVWDVQVLVPVNAKSKLSRRELNRILQRELNPTGQGCGGNPFRVGDKIVNTKNAFFKLWDEQMGKAGEKETFVANGELAAVVKVEEKLVVARLESPARLIVIHRAKGIAGDDESGEGEADDDARSASKKAEPSAEKEDMPATGCTWDLGYALSVHKSQGSEWPVVIVMLDEYPGARQVCSREWIYTGISRAKKLCLLVGKRSTADAFCRRQVLPMRKTFLVERIEEQKKLILAGRAIA